MRALFPGATIARVDRDTIRRRGAITQVLQGVARGDIDILVGTQMIAKGHDFPAVTLVGVVSADVGLGLADAGKPFPAEAPIFRECSVARTREQALRDAEPYLMQKYRAYADWGLDKPMPKGESLSAPYDDLVRDRFIVGTPDECRAEIRRYHDLLGVNHFLLRPQWPGMPQKLVLDQIELLGQHVFPALR